MEGTCSHVKSTQKYTKYKCDECGVVFKHFYDVHFSMNDGMKSEGVSTICKPSSSSSPE